MDNTPQVVFMQVYARYAHPVSRLALLRMLPWIAVHQNADGSWGDGPLKDVVTLAVVEALCALGVSL